MALVGARILELRRELGEVLGRLRELPADAFAIRANSTIGSELSRMLREIEIPGADGGGV